MNDQTRLISIKKVAEIAGLCKSEIYKRMSDGTFPKSIQLSPKCVRWSENEIYAWTKQQLETREIEKE